jgi:putative nucleotidyltransferase with HDIG domain
MEHPTMNGNEALNRTYSQLMPLVQTEFLPEKNIPKDSALREDYEKLRITYELQRDIGAEIEIDSVLNRVLDRTFEFLKYDRAIILLVDKKGKLKPRAHRNTSNEKKHLLSTTLIRHVLQKRKAIITSDILADNRFNMADSIRISGIRSSIAVPILHQEEILGVIIIESLKRFGAFTKKDLNLMINIANHTAQFVKNSLLHEELRISFNSAIRTLSAMVDARHPLTAGHSERVAKLSAYIAKEIGLSRNRIEALTYAALLHDIGKIGIPDKVLLKEGPFDSYERDEMNSHSIRTRKILDNFHFPKTIRNVPEIAALHHERLDGRGYPYGMTGNDLPLEAKIIAVADVFDALTSRRDYPKYDETGKPINCSRMPLSDSIAIIEKEVGSHFDEEVVAAFIRALPRALQHFRGTHFEAEYIDEFIRSRSSGNRALPDEHHQP